MNVLTVGQSIVVMLIDFYLILASIFFTYQIGIGLIMSLIIALNGLIVDL